MQLPYRKSDSHKGENGKVAIVGGSKFQHGAAIFSALAAEAAGADLIFLSLPKCHAEVAKSSSLNFQVHPFENNDLCDEDTDMMLELLATMDAAVIGPGLSRDDTSLHALKKILESASCALVLDASALQPWTLKTIAGKHAVLTPHLGELERMKIDIDDAANVTAKSSIVIHVKGQIDRVFASGENAKEISGGNAGLTVGGTGDALAGCIASFIAQGMAPVDACALASTVIKRAGDELAAHQKTFTTREVIARIPTILSSMS